MSVDGASLPARETRPLAVVLVSGGLDSCVTCAVAASSHSLALLHASYGQRTAARERRAFEKIADHYETPPSRRRKIDLSFLAEQGGSALIDRSRAIPEGLPGGGVPPTYVPFRNAILLSAAVSWAEVIGASSVWIGAVEEDGSGYPDCRETFLAAFSQSVRLGCRDGETLRIERPLVALSKREIVTLGARAGVPFHLTWSCYSESQTACGRCESCRLRRRGFEAAGIVDPLPYAVPDRLAPEPNGAAARETER